MTVATGLLVPPIMDDELLRHYWMRWRDVTYFENERQFARFMLGSAHREVDHFLPSHLGALSANIRPYVPTWTADYFIQNHTLYPYFAVGLTAQDRETFRKRMTVSHCGPTVLFQDRGELLTIRRFRFCPNCVEEDRARVGVAYARRAHHLPLVTRCFIHGAPLTGLTPTGQISTERFRNALDFARASASLLSVAEESSLAFRQTVRAMLQERGFASGSRISTGRLSASISDLMRDEFEGHACTALAAEASTIPRKLEAMFRTEARMHPVAIVLVLLLLSRTWPVSAIPEDNHAKKREAKHQAKLQAGLEALTAGASLRAAAEKSGLSIQTVKDIAFDNRIVVRTRPSKLSPELLSKIEVSLAQGRDVRAVAAAHGLSEITVYRILRNPTVRRAWEQVREASERTKCRRRWMRLVTNTKFLSHRQRVESSSGAYAWLFRHDRQWLRQSIAAHPVSRFVQARTRDSSMAPIVLARLLDITHSMDEARDSRMTGARLMRLAGVSDSVASRCLLDPSFRNGLKELITAHNRKKSSYKLRLAG